MAYRSLARIPARASCALLLLLLVAPGARSDVRPPDSKNAAEIREALAKLQVTGSVLYVAAHPDDENTAFIAWCSQGRRLRTGYLAMTRGDGGQNLIGTEIGSELGVLRTQELLAARRVDGGEQFFTRALDFGYSKSPDETMRVWDHDRVLADAVWVIRRFRPDVIVTRFGVDGSGGHGHHTASAMIAEEAFEAAADPARFPDQLARVKPWRAKRLLWNNWQAKRTPEGPPVLGIDLGDWNPRLGAAYTEIAGRSRSMHKSQGFGAPERRGTIPNAFEHRLGEPAARDLMDGVTLDWTRVPGGGAVARALEQASAAFDPERPAAIVPALLDADAAMASLPDEPLVRAKRRELNELVRACAGLWIEALAQRPTTSPGATLRVATSVLQRAGAPFSVESVALPGATETRWSGDQPGAEFAPLRAAPLASAGPFALEPNRTLRAEQSVVLPADAPITQPYWLERPARPGSFEVDDLARIGAPENAPALVARVTLALGARRFVVDAPVVYKWTDPVEGERYRPLEVAPPVTCRLDEPVVLFASAAPKTVRVIARASVSDTAATLRLEAPAGFRVEPASRAVRVPAGDAEVTAEFTVTPPAGAATGVLRAVAEVGGRPWSHRLVRIDHSHVPIQTLFPPAEAKLVRADVRASGGEVGYVMGSGDPVPEALRQLGFKVTLLSDDELERAPLQRFAAIVVGVRAYNTRERLRALKPRLSAYVEGGGRLVVQYDTADTTLDDRIGPYRFRISRDRVTVEEAEMHFKNAAHPLLTTPNRIGAADFDGWVQERGLYFAGSWDPRYETVLSANDPGESPKDGSILYAKFGKGVFVYTGLAWFRQLPAGVPGAYRLFANLVSAPRP